MAVSRQILRSVVLAALLTAGLFAAAQESTWDHATWVDPSSGELLPAVVTPTTAGLDGQVVLACRSLGLGGLTLVLESPELADMTGQVQVAVDVGLEQPIRLEPDLWARQAGDTVLAWVGPQDALDAFVAVLEDAESPEFAVHADSFEEEPEGVLAIESRGLAAALGDLPCSAQPM